MRDRTKLSVALIVIILLVSTGVALAQPFDKVDHDNRDWASSESKFSDFWNNKLFSFLRNFFGSGNSLTGAQVAGCVAPPPNMVAWWPLDGDTLDIQGSHDGTSDAFPIFIPGQVAQGFFLNGVDDAVTVPDSNDWAFPGDFTIDFWVRFDAFHPGSGDYLVTQGQQGSSNQWFLWYDSSNTDLVFTGINSGSTSINVRSDIFIPAGPWRHITLTRSGSQFTFYIDGFQLSPSPGFTNVYSASVANAPHPLTLGRLPGLVPTDGGIDEVEIFNRALSLSEIQSIVNAGASGKCKPACGDNLINVPGEVCDGTNLAGQTCATQGFVSGTLACSGSCDAFDTSSCVASICGDGSIDGSESCDDGGTTPGDGCSATCAVESGFVCSGEPSVCSAIVCGDSLIQGTETCDDGGVAPGDGCSATCSVENGFVCSGEPSVCVVSQCATPPSGLVSWWPGESSGADIVGPNDAALSGVSFSTGKVGNAFTFDGVDDYVNPPSILNTPLQTGSFTISGWVKSLDNLASSIFILNRGVVFTGGNEHGVSFYVTPGNMWLDRHEGTSTFYRAQAPTAISATDFNFVTVSYDKPTGNVNFYLNGVHQGSAVLGTGNVAYTPSFDLGYSVGALRRGVSDVYSNALIDELVVHDRVLSAPEIQSIFDADNEGMCGKTCGDGFIIETEQCDDNNGAGGDGCSATCSVEPGFTCNGQPSVCTEPCGDAFCDFTGVESTSTCSADCGLACPVNSMQAWWAAENNGLDKFNGHDGTVIGATFTTGQVGSAFSFDGIDDYIDAGTAIPQAGFLTVDFWVNAAHQASLNFGMFAWNDLSNAKGLSCNINTDDTVSCFFRDDAFTSGSFPSVTSTGTVADGTWHHVAFVYDGDAKIYIDGVLSGTTTRSSLLTGIPGISFQIGHLANQPPGSLHFKGAIDELTVTNRALIPAEIQAIQDAGSAGQCVVTEVCGDAAVEGSEECDDGNVLSGDGCSATCQQEDTDNDGVFGVSDVCPGTPLGEAVAANGCSDSQVSDGDLVVGAADLCPGTAVSAIVDVHGCSDPQVDTDGDGSCNVNAPSKFT